MIDADLSKDIARQKVEEVLKTGAEAVVTACQQCVRTMTTCVRRNKIQLKVLDIVKLVRMAVREE
jgi:heterodisulfide reductase subunit D